MRNSHNQLIHRTRVPRAGDRVVMLQRAPDSKTPPVIRCCGYAEALPRMARGSPGGSEGKGRLDEKTEGYSFLWSRLRTLR